MSRRAALVLVIAAATPAACSVTPGEVTSGFPGVLPANGKLVVFVRPPLDIVFERVDGPDVQVLSHEVIGSGAARDDRALLVDVGDVSSGDVITIVGRCDGCDETAEIAIVDDDTTSPSIGAGPAELTARGIRNNPFDPLVALYEVQPAMQAITDDLESTVFIRYRGDDIDVLRHVASNFMVDGGVERTLCVTITLMDVAGNETALPDEECVHLDPSTAPPLGQLPPPPG